MMTLTREQILEKRSEFAIEFVESEVLGGLVGVREMDGGSRDRWDTWLFANVKEGLTTFPIGFRARLVLCCACDVDGRPLFTEDDFDALLELPGAALTEIADVALRVNALSASEFEEAEGN